MGNRPPNHRTAVGNTPSSSTYNAATNLLKILYEKGLKWFQLSGTSFLSSKER